jgi:hypothetical protein
MSLFKKSSSKVSSRQQIAIQGVEDGILMLPGNKYRAILEVSSLNLELKSDAEKDAIIETYQNFLNSLACSVQVLIKVREIDIDKYLEDYRTRLANEKEEVYKQQIEGYVRFVRSLIQSNKILTRQFYVVVPYDDVSKSSKAFVKDQLDLNIGIIKNGLEKLGMQTRQLSSLEVLELFYTFYNEEKAKLQPLTAATMEMLTKQYI